MSDFDRTIISGTGASGSDAPPPSFAPPPEPKKRNPLLIFGGIGCLLLLCAVVVFGGGAYWYTSRQTTLTGLSGTEEPAPALATEVVAAESPTAIPVVVIETPVEAPTDSAAPPTEEASGSATPEIGLITFALGATDNFEPVSPAANFDEGLTEIHAIFDYSGMSKEFTWERVWYLNGEELLRNSAAWTDPETGRFDYFLDAGGDPLPPGDWVLEIYVQGELLATGNFTVVSSAPPPTEVAQATATRVATVTPTPTLTPTVAAKPAGGGVYKLVFTKWDGGQHNMYVADTNGKNEKFLLNRAAGPSWTPNGQEIFFFGEEGVDRQRLPDGRDFVFDGVSNGIVALTNASPVPNTEDAQLFQGIDWKQGSARWANVSPDGQMVAFDAKPGGNYRIYFLGTSDNQQYRFEIEGEQADWSPNSQKVAYRSGRNGQTGIWISNRDDSGHTLISNGGADSFPAWSPDGKTIAFSRDEGGNVDIYAMNTDGSNVRRLTDAPGPDSLPVYTPGGDIIFRSARTGSWGIWKMSGSGGGQTEIIPNAGVGPDWAFSRMDVR